MLGNGLCVGIHVKRRMGLLPTYAFRVILLTPREAYAAYPMVGKTRHRHFGGKKNSNRTDRSEKRGRFEYYSAQNSRPEAKI
jgi:hypothetical protein